MATNKSTIREAHELLARAAQILMHEKGNADFDSVEFAILENTQDEAEALARRLSKLFKLAA